MGVVHVFFGSTLLLMFGMNLILTLPGSESATFFDRVAESQPATAIKGVLGQFSPHPQKDQPPTDQQSTTPSTTTTGKTASEPGSILNRVIGHFAPLPPHLQGDSKPDQTTTSSTTTSTTSTTTTDAPKQSEPSNVKSEGKKTASEPGSIVNRVIGHFAPLPHLQGDSKPDQTATSTSTTSTTSTTDAPTQSEPSSLKSEGVKTTEEGGEATVPPFVATCYLWKNESGIVKAVKMSRDEAGNDTYVGYEEYCTGDDIDNKISAGALASLAGINKTNEEDGLTTIPTYDEICYLQKNDTDGVINTIYMSREEAGNDTYIDYEEICDDGADVAVPLAISAGALASLAG